ncbi:kinesin-II 85 kDa subunit isoform X2 [Panicum miliaceum]|uniref:Kinesin-II 85 kDa subunit isoform X2 n=1 Tax=Panicum miliaceum TaxID=4540 RepID=A0A3L6S7Q9_PANMI|nr:kinesin-II 85 kDa subunit isoform X2 [Panicum miliaceum]
MDFSWTADGENHAAACASPGRDEEDAPAPAPALSPQEVAESMILVSGPRVVMSGLRMGDCRSENIATLNESMCLPVPPNRIKSSDAIHIATETRILLWLGVHWVRLLNKENVVLIQLRTSLFNPQVLSQLDVYAVVGGNRPLQVRDIRVTVEMNGAIMVDFKGVRGSPMVCGICIRKAPVLTANSVTDGNALCKRCSADIDFSSTQTRTSKLISKYEKQIEELTSQCTMKTNECYMAWSSVDTTNLELGRLKIELHQKGAEMDSLEQALGRESGQLRNVSQKYENDKKLWTAAISNLERKIKAMKQEQALLSLEAHDCANAIPDLSKMIGAVQALVAQCEDLKLKYYEEMDKRKKLHNIVQETKGNIRVFCRCQPLSKDEVSSGQKYVVDFDGANDGDIVITNAGTSKKTFRFDRVFTPKDDQDILVYKKFNYLSLTLQGQDWLEIKQSSEGYHHVPGLVEAKVENIKELLLRKAAIFPTGRDSKALMFVQISPSDNDVSETLSSLNFASRVRRIELGPAKKQVDTVELQKTKQMLERAKQEGRLKDDSLRKLEENLQNLETKAKGKEQLCKNLQEKVKELEGQLDSKAHSQITSEKQQRQLSGKLKERRNIVELECKLRQPHQSDSEVEVLKQTIKELEFKLKEQEHDRSAVELKNKELELKLKEQEHQRSVAELKAREIGHELLETQRTEAMLQIKLRDLESKTKVQETNMTLDSAIATPREAKLPPFSRGEAMSEKEKRFLRSSNSLNKQQPLSENSSVPDGPEAAVNEKKRKGDARNASIGGEQENNGLAAGQNVGRKRSLPGEREARVKRKSTEPQVKNLGRSTASSRAAAAATHKVAAPSSRVPRQQPGGTKTRGWVR